MLTWESKQGERRLFEFEKKQEKHEENIERIREEIATRKKSHEQFTRNARFMEVIKRGGISKFGCNFLSLGYFESAGGSANFAIAMFEDTPSQDGRSFAIKLIDPSTKTELATGSLKLEANTAMRIHLIGVQPKKDIVRGTLPLDVRLVGGAIVDVEQK